MAKGNSKQRAKKKQQKQQHRKTKLARREGKAAPMGQGGGERSADLLKGWDAKKHGIVGLAQRKKLPFYEAAHYADSAFKAGHPGAAHILTPSRVATLTEEQIFGKLASLGIVTEKASFLAVTEGQLSALPRAGEPWSRALPGTAPVSDHDFVRLAAWDLWRRYRPEKPSIEMLHARHLEGWDAHGQDRLPDAIEAWLELGQMMWKAFPTAKSMLDIDLAMNGSATKKGGFYFDAFTEVLAGIATEEVQHHVIGHDDEDEEHAHDHEHDPEGAIARARKVVTYLVEVEERLPNSPLEHIELLKVTRANMLDTTGERDAAMKILSDLVERSPNRAIGYVMLATAVVEDLSSTDKDFQGAIELLEKARSTEDAQSWGVETRLEMLKGLLAEMQLDD